MIKYIGYFVKGFILPSTQKMVLLPNYPTSFICWNTVCIFYSCYILCIYNMHKHEVSMTTQL